MGSDCETGGSAEWNEVWRCCGEEGGELSSTRKLDEFETVYIDPFFEKKKA